MKWVETSGLSCSWSLRSLHAQRMRIQPMTQQILVPPQHSRHPMRREPLHRPETCRQA
jgi:hypothetical protein